METYFIDGQVDEATKKQIDIAIKLEKIRHTKDPLQEKQKAIEKAVSRAQRGMHDISRELEDKIRLRAYKDFKAQSKG